VLRNANGLAQLTAKVKTYIQTQKADVMLISEMYFTTRSYNTSPNYTIFVTHHPDGTAHGGTAVIVKMVSNITSMDFIL
jgi:exonuclease III